MYWHTLTFSLTTFKTSWSLPLATGVVDENISMFSFLSSITFFATFNGGSVSEDLICFTLSLQISSFSAGSAWTSVWLPPQLTLDNQRKYHQLILKILVGEQPTICTFKCLSTIVETSVGVVIWLTSAQSFPYFPSPHVNSLPLAVTAAEKHVKQLGGFSVYSAGRMFRTPRWAGNSRMLCTYFKKKKKRLY